MTDNVTLYVAPECELCDSRWGDLLCDSPAAGGNEDVGYDDWVI